MKNFDDNQENKEVDKLTTETVEDESIENNNNDDKNNSNTSMEQKDKPQETKKSKSFIGNLIDELDFGKEEESGESDLTDTQKLRLNLGEVSALKDRRRLISKQDQKRLKKEKKYHQKIPQEKTSEDDVQEKNHQFREPIYHVSDNKKSKKWLFVLVPLMVIAIAVGTVLFMGSSSYGLDQLEPTFNTALDKADASAFSKLVEIKGLGRTPTKADYDSLIAYINGKPSYRSSLEETIKKETGMLESGSAIQKQGFFKVKKSINRYLLMPGYKLELDAVNVKLPSTKYQILQGDKPIQTNNETMAMVPGYYKLVKTVGILKLSTLTPVDNTMMVEGVQTLNFDDDVATLDNPKIKIEKGKFELEIKGAPKDGIVFVNDKNTDMTVSEFNDMEQTNINPGDKITVVSKVPWGFAYSESKSAQSGDQLDLKVELLTEDMKTRFIDIAKKTLKEDAEAFESSDPSKYTTLTGEALKSVTDWIELNKGYNQAYLRDYKTLVVDLSSMELTKGGWLFGGYTGYLGGFITYGEKKFTGAKPSIESLPITEDKKIGFHFEYNSTEKKWMVRLFGNTYRNISKTDSLTVNLKQ